MLNKQKLMPSDRRERFVHELQEHADDAGNAEQLGNPHELTQLFNAYTLRKQLHRTALLLAIGVITALPSALLLYTDIQYGLLTSIMGQLAYHLDVIGSLTIFPLYTFPFVSNGNLFPVLTGLAWSLYTYFLLYPPRPSYRLFIIAAYTLSYVWNGASYPDGYGYFEATIPTFVTILIISILIDWQQRQPSSSYANR